MQYNCILFSYSIVLAKNSNMTRKNESYDEIFRFQLFLFITIIIIYYLFFTLYYFLIILQLDIL